MPSGISGVIKAILVPVDVLNILNSQNHDTVLSFIAASFAFLGNGVRDAVYLIF